MGFMGGMAGGPRAALERAGEDGDKREFDAKLVQRFLVYIRPYWRRMVIALIAMIGTTVLTLLAPYLIRIAIDYPITQGDIDGLNQIALWLLLSFAGIYILNAVERYLLSWVGQRVLADLRDALFVHLQRLSLSYHERTIVGVTISRVISDVSVINQLLSQGLVTLIGDTLLLAGIIIVMLSMNPRLALITFSVLPFMVIATIIFARRAKVAFRETRARNAAVVASMAENLGAMRVIQAFAREERSLDEFETVNDSNREAHVKAISLSFIFIPAVDFLGILATGVVLWFGGAAVINGTITIGIVVAFLTYVTRFFQPIQELTQLYAMMQSAMAGGERVINLLDSPPTVTDRPDAIDAPPLDGHIELRDVRFAYRDGVEVLHGINLEIEPGQTVALVGPTGAGKSSIANLIARFYDVTDGAVLIDRHDVRDFKQRSFRRQMALVSQDPFVFAGTIADNIRFARPDADDEAIQAAARAANVHEFIMTLPDGYNTKILEDGANLSIGQRQLISIARAVLADPRILIMDEATSSVDMVTEMLIQDALDRLLRDRTAIVIAHRLSTIVNADMICVVQAGRIVERGRHADLLALGGLYDQLHERQFTEVQSE